MKKIIHFSHSFLSLFLLLVFTGCVPGGPAGGDSLTLFKFQETGGEARLSVFMNLKEPSGPSIWMEIDEVEVLTGERWLPIGTARKEISSKELGASGQLLVARGGVDAGSIKRLRLKINKAALERDGQKIFLALDTPVLEMALADELTLRKGESACLFIRWDTSSSVRNVALFAPQMAVDRQSIPLTTDLAYVACPDIDTVYIIRTDQNRVCGSIGVSGGPTCLEVNVARNRLYVLSPGESSIAILELTSNRALDNVRIPHVQQATYMAVSPDGEWAYILDERGDQLLRLNLVTGVLADTVRLGSRPRFITYLAKENLLAVSSAYAQKVVFLDPHTLATVQTIATGGSPDGLAVADNLIYIAERTTNTVAIYDTISGRSRARVNVGIMPTRLISGNNNMYLANSGSGTISILRPGQLNVLREIRLGGRPYEMAVYSDRQWLYVGDQEGRGVSVIDLSSNRVVRTIELAAQTSGLALVN